jgi:cytochrome P450
MAGATQIEDLQDQSFNPYLADDVMFGVIEDPYTILDEVRSKAPVAELSISGLIDMPTRPVEGYEHEYTVLSYAGVEQVLNDPITFSNRSLRELLANYGPLLPGLDPPEHTRYRRIFQRAFRPAIVQQWGEDILPPVLERLLEPLRGAGHAELVEQFVRPYPFNVLYRLMALPAEDIEVFYRLTMAQITTVNAAEASAKLRRYFSAMLEQRRERPGRDLISVLAATEVDGEPLPQEVTLAFLLTLLSAAGETTFRTVTVLLTGLLTAEEQLEAVRRDRSLIPQAVEEALRWDGPVVTSTRATTCDTVIDGVAVPKHSLINVAYGAANRDPAVFADPERFDIFREHHRHFAFAFGAHNCLGQQLARLEIATALEALLDHLPGLRLDPTEPEPRLRGASMRTPRALHVLFDS